MSVGVIIAVLAGIFSLAGTVITASFGLVAARKARDAERARERANQDRDRELADKENAVRIMELYGKALKEEREESKRLRAELRRRPPEIRR